jgi:hypothetical protein
VTGAAGVMALVLAETVAGASALLWLTPLWGEVKRSYFTLSGVMLSLFALGAWRAAMAGAVAGDGAGRWSIRLSIATLVAIAIWTALMLARKHLPARVVGCLSLVPATLAIVAMGGTGRQQELLCLFQLIAGAAFLGSVLDGLFLGHWYLTDRGLSRAPIQRYTLALLIAVCVEAVAVITGGFKGTGASSQINPLLTAGALAPWIALGMVITTGVIAVLVKLALRGTRASAVQSATGFFYLAVVTAFTAEVAVKTRFFPR